MSTAAVLSQEFENTNLSAPEFETVADLLHGLGDVPPDRVLRRPAPGTATEADVIRLHDRYNRLFELVEGTLVEKAMGYLESRVAFMLGHSLQSYLDEHDIGIAAGADGMMRLEFGLVRIPVVSFVSWDRLPGRKVPNEPIPALAPDLAVEVLSPGNTPREMARKLGEYFAAGVRLVWYIDPRARTARVFTAVDQVVDLDETGILDGRDVLPGFQLRLSELLAQLDRHG